MRGSASCPLADLCDDMEIERFGEHAVRVILGTSIDEATHDKVRRFFLYVRSLDIGGVVDVIPSFRSCLIDYDRDVTDHHKLSLLLAGKKSEWEHMAVPEPRRFEVPVAYGGDYGPDMDYVCSYSGLSSDEVIEAHTAVTYRVFAVGFMPGFPYLGILDRKIYVPRQETPVLKVPGGSVGIAQLQTGIYPFESPAGWRVIGRTTTRLFDHSQEPFSLLSFGDTVRFVRA